MESLLSGITQHGYSILFAAVFLETVGFPVPAALALMIAGGAAARGSLIPVYTVTTALGAMLIGDTLMFLMGRHTGWWLLGLLCRLSLNPESCILRSAESFYRRGRLALVFAKFIPGINTMAPPLAGSMNMRYSQFFLLDSAGAALYCGSYLAVGFLFSGALDAVTRGYHTFGHVLAWVLGAAIAGYAGFQYWMWRKSRSPRAVPVVSPSDAAQALSSDAAVVLDVRSHGYYDRKAKRIRGSKRLEPNALHRAEIVPHAGKPVYLYCTCIRQATSSRVAQALLDKGIECAVIEGGLRSWEKAGLPIESVPSEEMAALPVFER